jgi:hypothetical protein
MDAERARKAKSRRTPGERPREQTRTGPAGRNGNPPPLLALQIWADDR